MIQDLLLQLEGLTSQDDFILSPEDFKEHLALTQLMHMCYDKHSLLSYDKKTLSYKSEEIKILFSLIASMQYNILVCEWRGELILIGQYVTSIDFLYLPYKKFFFKAAHIDEVIGYNVVKDFEKALQDCINYFSTEEKVDYSFGYLLDSHDRPYHFFYDACLGMQYLVENNALKDKRIIQIQDRSFIDFSYLGLENKFMSLHEINKFSIVNKIYNFKIGINYHLGNDYYDDLITKFDRRMIQAYKNVSNKYKSIEVIESARKNDYLIVWFGITGDKRAWIEQKETVLALVDLLLPLHNIVLIIDGLTATNGQSRNSHTFNNDNKIFEEIVQSFKCEMTEHESLLNAKSSDSNVISLQKDARFLEIISLVGAKSEEKIRVSSLIDFHVSNGGTGSLWTSRINKKMGILHLSQAFNQTSKSMHIHHHTIDFPNNKVIDQDVNGLRMDFVSYSIPTKDFLAFVKLNYPILFKEDFRNRYRFDVKSYQNLNLLDLEENLFESLSNDPQIYLRFIEDSQPTESYKLTIECYIQYKGTLVNNQAKLYIDYGEGFNEQDTLHIELDNYNSDYIKFDLPVNKMIHNLRFDPMASTGKLVIQGIFYKIN